MSTAADDVDETPGVGGGDGNGTPPELVDDVPAVGGGGGNGNNVDNALQPAQMGQGLGQGSLPQVANLAKLVVAWVLPLLRAFLQDQTFILMVCLCG